MRLQNNMIEPSMAGYHSHVHLVPKPNGKWHFTIDFRHLNTATTTKLNWPLPNIRAMLQRLGQKRPKFFAKFDMTSGYFQAPLHPDSWKYTAFKTPRGNFHWKRVPMGLSCAGSWFQYCIQHKVLAGLAFNTCEGYLDDIIVHASSEPELLARLVDVFERFRQFNITLNPDKCEFGLTEIEFVGHVLDGDGVRFSAEKLDGIRAIALPTTRGLLKSFMGLANYFRDHVPDYASMEHTILPVLGTNYTKRARKEKLTWTESGIQAFERLKLAITNCQPLWFEDPTRPLHLRTDASDHGIGAILFQFDVEKNIRPIHFLSKALDRRQVRWSVPEKEAYAIHFALTKMEYLLRDRPFILETDHENLTRIYASGSPKVYRWHLELQNFPCSIRHIKGADNDIADSLSRLCTTTAIPDDNDVVSSAYSVIAVPTLLKNTQPDSVISLAAHEILRSLPPDTHAKIRMAHNELVGHHGIEKTTKKLHQLGHRWTHMREDVSAFIKQCSFCQKSSQVHPKPVTQLFTTSADNPMDVINFDTIGPLQKDREYDYEHILVVIDRFTRWVELYPLRTVSASEAARALLNHAGRYGHSKRWISDQGSQFMNETFTELSKSLGTHHEFTIACSKEENAIVERANKEVMRHLRALLFVAGQFSSWSTYLPIVQRILNSTTHQSIGMSPAECFMPWINLDRVLISNPAIDPCDTPTTLVNTEWSKHTHAAHTAIVDAAQTFQANRNEAHLQSQTTDEAGNIPDLTTYNTGQLVLITYPDSILGAKPPNKFNTILKGPFTVISNVGATYEIRNLRTHRITKVHVSRLVPYEHDPSYTDPIAIAAKDSESYLVHEIVAHKGNTSTKSDMTFLVHWEGYDDPRDFTWEPWSSLNTNEKLHTYLNKKGLGTLIPLSYREPRPKKTTLPRQDGPEPPSGTTATVEHEGREKRSRRKRTWED
jgi:transposase InsO family protein